MSAVHYKRLQGSNENRRGGGCYFWTPVPSTGEGKNKTYCSDGKQQHSQIHHFTSPHNVAAPILSCYLVPFVTIYHNVTDYLSTHDCMQKYLAVSSFNECQSVDGVALLASKIKWTNALINLIYIWFRIWLPFIWLWRIYIWWWLIFICVWRKMCYFNSMVKGVYVITGLLLQGKLRGGIEFGVVMSPWPSSPAGFYADACTDMSVSAKRQDNRWFYRQCDQYWVKSGILAALNIKGLEPQIEKKNIFTPAALIENELKNKLKGEFPFPP